MRSAAVVLALALAAPLALADGEIKLDVPLGKQIRKNVGYARGWMCDDPSLVTAELVTVDDHNEWIVKGEKLGTTLCRVGTQPMTPVYYVFEVHVVAAPKKR